MYDVCQRAGAGFGVDQVMGRLESGAFRVKLARSGARGRRDRAARRLKMTAQPPKPAPVRRAPSAPPAMAVSTSSSSAAVLTCSRSRRLACDAASKCPKRDGVALPHGFHRVVYARRFAGYVIVGGALFGRKVGAVFGQRGFPAPRIRL